MRLIAATNRDLEQEVAEAVSQRSFHRLKVYPIHVPPLREHKADLDTLSSYFLDQARMRLGLRQIGLHPHALLAMQTYDWPGNVA